jgi:hypothetical protein
MALEQITNIYNVAKSKARDMLTADPDFNKDELAERKDTRVKIYNTMDLILSGFSGVDENNQPIEVRNTPKDSEWWGTEDGRTAKRRLTSLKNLIDGKYEITYQELSHEEKWINSLRKISQAETGKEWEGTDQALTEEYFERYNDFANSLTTTTYKGLTDSFWFSEFDEETLKLVADTYDTFHKTDMTGLGSRPIYEQSKDFIMQSGSDPTTLASIYFTGGLAKFGTTAIAPLVMRKVVTDQISKRALLASSSFTSALVGGNINANLQMVDQRMANQDELNIDKSQVALMSGVSAVLPASITGASKLISPLIPYVESLALVPQKIASAVEAPLKTIFKNKAKGQGAAAFHMLEKQEKQIIRASTDTAPEDLAAKLMDDVINPANQTISDGFASLKYIDMPVASQQKLRNIIAKHNIDNPNAPLDKQINDILLTMFDEKALNKHIKQNGLKNAQIAGSLKGSNTAQTYTDLKTALYDLAQEAGKNEKHLNADAYMSLYRKIKDVQELSLANAGEKELWTSLNRANTEFKRIMEDNDVGKFYAEIKKHSSASARFANDGDMASSVIQAQNAKKSSQALLNFLLHDKDALSNLLVFKTGLDKVDLISRNVQKAVKASNETDALINSERAKLGQFQMEIRPTIENPATANSYNQLIKTVKDELGVYLELEASKGEGIGYAALDSLISRKDGYKLIKTIFPESAKFYDDLAIMKKFLQGQVEKKAGQSVIINMTVARMAADLGTSVGGKFGGFAAPVASVPILQKYRSQLGDVRWQKAMADTINNGGRVPTWFKKFLKFSGNKMTPKKVAWTDTQIADLVEDWSIMLQGTIVPKNLQNIDEEMKDKGKNVIIFKDRSFPLDDGSREEWSGLSLKDLYMGGQGMLDAINN